MAIPIVLSIKMYSSIKQILPHIVQNVSYVPNSATQKNNRCRGSIATSAFTCILQADFNQVPTAYCQICFMLFFGRFMQLEILNIQPKFYMHINKIQLVRVHRMEILVPKMRDALSRKTTVFKKIFIFLYTIVLYSTF